MKQVAVVTVGRSDYGIYRSILKALEGSDQLDPTLVVSGSHLSPEFGMTAREIESDGFKIGARVEMLLSSDSPEAVSKSMGLGLIGFAQAYAATKPDMLMVLGDRFEMMAAALAALPMNIPVAHIHGGELSLGAIDDAMRHSITKMSHLHFVSTETYGKRVVQLGEEPWRVTVCGAPGLDLMKDLEPLRRGDFAKRFGVDLRGTFLLVTYHPVTVGGGSPDEEFQAVCEALHATGKDVLFTMPNPDPGGRAIRARIREQVSRRGNWAAVESLGSLGYCSAMRYTSAMVGNSSSGIIEAASFGLPVVNVGLRQDGRVRGRNVIDVPGDAVAIEKAIRQAIGAEFKASLKGIENPYGRGDAAGRIVEVIERTPFDERLLKKRFHDLGDPD